MVSRGSWLPSMAIARIFVRFLRASLSSFLRNPVQQARIMATVIFATLGGRTAFPPVTSDAEKNALRASTDREKGDECQKKVEIMHSSV